MLLSINPEHVENILNGNKQFEFRKIRCRANVDKIVIYATSPVMKVIGEVDVINIISDIPEKVWQLTSEYAGISKQFYDTYYKDKKLAIAYHLGDIVKYEEPLSLEDFGLSYAPQSFVYI